MRVADGAAHADTALAAPAAASTKPSAAGAVDVLVSLMREWHRSAKKTQQKMLRLAEELVDQDPRVPPEVPPPYIVDIAAYHAKRGRILKDLLVECIIAYFNKTGLTMDHVPVPMPFTNDDL